MIDITEHWTAFKAALDGIKAATDIWRNLKPGDEPPPELEAALELALSATWTRLALSSSPLRGLQCADSRLAHRRLSYRRSVVKNQALPVIVVPRRNP